MSPVGRLRRGGRSARCTRAPRAAECTDPRSGRRARTLLAAQTSDGICGRTRKFHVVVEFRVWNLWWGPNGRPAAGLIRTRPRLAGSSRSKQRKGERVRVCEGGREKGTRARARTQHIPSTHLQEEAPRFTKFITTRIPKHLIMIIYSHTGSTSPPHTCRRMPDVNLPAGEESSRGRPPLSQQRCPVRERVCVCIRPSVCVLE